MAGGLNLRRVNRYCCVREQAKPFIQQHCDTKAQAKVTALQTVASAYSCSNARGQALLLCLFVSQRIDRVKFRSFVCWIYSEKYPYAYAKEEGKRD